MKEVQEKDMGRIGADQEVIMYDVGIGGEQEQLT